MYRIESNFKVKYEKCLVDLRYVKPTLLRAFVDVVEYCKLHEYPLQVTRVVGEKIKNISVSTSHEEGRAIDISVKGMTEKQINNMVEYFNVKFYNIGAISYSKGVSTFMYYHVGTAKHIHIQIRPNI